MLVDLTFVYCMLVYRTLVYIENLCLDLQPDRIMTEFQLATLNAAVTMFSRAAGSKYLFHLGQSVYRNICNLG